MKNIFRILLSLTVFGVMAYCYIMEMAVSSSSHNIGLSERKEYVSDAETAIIICFVLLVILWLPWKIILKKARNKGYFFTLS